MQLMAATAEWAEGKIALHRISEWLSADGTLSASVWADASREQGNCYPVAAAVAEAAQRAGYKALVIHGRPTLSVEPRTPYEHAWVEIETRLGPFAVDLSNGCNVAMPVADYYTLGKIKIEDDAGVYSPVEVWQLIMDNGHYGPFHIPVDAGKENEDGQE